MIYKIFNYVFQKLGRVALAGLGVFSLFLLGRNSRLSKQNNALNQVNAASSKTIEIQKKVIDVTKNRKRVDLSGILERMRQDEL